MLPQLFREPGQPMASRPHMPGYGILDADSGQGLLPWSWATERLSRQRTYWLSTTRSDYLPHAMPIWGVWMDNVFCFSTGEYSRKARNLEGMPFCVVGVTTGDDSVILEGAVWPVVAYGFSAAAGEFTGRATRWTFATTEWNRRP